MKKNTTIWLLLIALCSIFASCKKETTNLKEEQLPPETQTGAFTIGFKVDGIIYSAKGKGGLLADQHMYYSYTADSSFNIGAGSIINKKFSIDINFKGNSLGYVNIPYPATFSDNSNGTIPGSSNTYSTNSINTGNIIIKYFNGTFYSGNAGTILVGTFDFYAANANGKVVHITEGRFDIGR